MFHSPSKQLSEFNGRCSLLLFLTTLVPFGSTSSSRSVDPHENASSTPLSPLHRDPDKFKDRQDKYFKIQIGLKLDTASLWQFKPNFLRWTVSQPHLCYLVGLLAVLRLQLWFLHLKLRFLHLKPQFLRLCWLHTSASSLRPTHPGCWGESCSGFYHDLSSSATLYLYLQLIQQKMLLQRDISLFNIRHAFKHVKL